MDHFRHQEDHGPKFYECYDRDHEVHRGQLLTVLLICRLPITLDNLTSSLETFTLNNTENQFFQQRIEIMLTSRLEIGKISDFLNRELGIDLVRVDEHY